MSKSILIIEDEIQIMDQYKTILESVGYSVSKALNGDIGLEDLEKNPLKYSLILLDLMMPGISGTEVLQKIKDNPTKYGNAKIIVLTNVSNERTIKDCFDKGANGYLIKTQIDLMGLISEVEKTLKE